MELKKINVLFNQEEHTYTNTETGKSLRGITSTLMQLLFPDKYLGVPQEVLRKAAEKGSVVHEDIELMESLGTTPATSEGKAYMQLRDENKLKYVASEYTVSDMENFATNIDAVYEGGKSSVDIADFKTTYKFDMDAVSWQLSICAYLFEKNNDIKVRNLYGIWLRGDQAQLIKVERRSDEEVEKLIAAYLAGETVYEWKSIPEYITTNEDELYALGKQIKELQERYDTLKADLLTHMEADGLKSVDTGAVLITYVAPSSRETFDSKKFKAEHEDMYGDYIKKSTTKASLKITLR